MTSNGSNSTLFGPLQLKVAHLPELIHRQSEENGQHKFIVEYDATNKIVSEEITFKEYYNNVKRTKEVLTAPPVNLTAGERVAILSRNNKQHLNFLGATWSCRATVVELPYGHPNSTLVELLSLTKSKILVYADYFEKRALELLASSDTIEIAIKLNASDTVSKNITTTTNVKSLLFYEDELAKVTTNLEDVKLEYPDNNEDECLIVFTSGTTSRPKAVIHTHKSLLYCCESKYQTFKDYFDQKPVIVCFLPLFHVIGITNNFIFNLYTGGKYPINPFVQLNADTLLTALDVLQPSALDTVPYLADQLMELVLLDASKIRILNRLHMVSYGGCSLSSKTIKFYQANNISLWPNWGQTELGGAILYSTCAPIMFPMKGVSYKIGVNKSHTTANVKTGELILTNCHSLCKGYINVASDRFANDGYHTNDIFTEANEGNDSACGLKYELRNDDILIHTTGEMTASLQIQELLISDSSGVIQYCCVIGHHRPHNVVIIELAPQWREEIVSPATYDKVWNVVSRINLKLATASRISKNHIYILGTTEKLPMSPKGIPLRQKAIVQFKDVIEKMYKPLSKNSTEEHQNKLKQSSAGLDCNQSYIELLQECEFKRFCITKGYRTELQDAVWKFVAYAAESLGLPLEQFNTDQNNESISFYDFGLSSLQVVELSERLTRSLPAGIEVSTVAAFQFPVLEDFCAHISTLLLDSVSTKSVNTGSSNDDSVLESCSPNEDIAIVGYGMQYPGGIVDLETFWDTISNKKDHVKIISPARWDVNEFYDANPDAVGKTWTKEAAFLEDVDKFDAAFFGIIPKEANAMDPQHRLLLEVAWSALENSGNADLSRLKNSDVGIYIGMLNREYSMMDGGIATTATTSSSMWGQGTMFSAAVGRLSYFLNVNGPSMVLDTACSGSLVSIDLACKSLRERESSLCLAGGVNLNLSPHSPVYLTKARMSSPTGRCHTFDIDADGFSPADGCGIVVLKRLSDAKADGDNILGLIKATAVNHNGRSNGLTAPSTSAQIKLLRAAVTKANMPLERISLLETHGTGTKLGDAVELQAIEAVFKERKCSTPLHLSSVKSNIGHSLSAAGAASLLKVLSCMKYASFPAQCLFNKLNPALPNLNGFGAVIDKEVASWSREDDRPRVAAISSFGFGGTNCCLILEEYNNSDAIQAVHSDAEPWHIFVASTKREANLKRYLQKIAKFLANKSYVDASRTFNIANLCYSSQVGRTCFTYRAAVVANSLPQLQQLLMNYDTAVSTTNSTKPVALFLPDKIGGTTLASLPNVVKLFVEHDLTPADQNSFAAHVLICVGIVDILLQCGLKLAAVSGYGLGLIVCGYITKRFTLKQALSYATALDNSTLDINSAMQVPSTSAVTFIPFEQQSTLYNDLVQLTGVENTYMWFSVGNCAQPTSNSEIVNINIETIKSFSTSVATLYCGGFVDSVKFEVTNGSSSRCKVPFPGIPLQRSSYWNCDRSTESLYTELNNNRQQSGCCEWTSSNQSAGRVPFCSSSQFHYNISAESLSMECVMSSVQHKWLTDHKVAKEQVIPMTAIAELFLEFGLKARQYFQHLEAIRHFTISDLSLQELIIHNAAIIPVTINHVHLQVCGTLAHSKKHLKAKLYSNSTSKLLATANIDFFETTNRDGSFRSIEDLFAISKPHISLDTQQIYSALKQDSLNYGATFQGIKSIKVSSREAVSVIEVDELSYSGSFIANPIVFDNCVHSIAAFMLGNKDPLQTNATTKKTFLPFSIEKILLFEDKVNCKHCVSHFIMNDRPFHEKTATKFSGSITVYDGDTKRKVAQLLNVTLSEVDVASLTSKPVPLNYLYQETWHKSELIPTKTEQSDLTILLVGEPDSTVTQTLVKVIESSISKGNRLCIVYYSSSETKWSKYSTFADNRRTIIIPTTAQKDRLAEALESATNSGVESCLLINALSSYEAVNMEQYLNINCSSLLNLVQILSFGKFEAIKYKKLCSLISVSNTMLHTTNSKVSSAVASATVAGMMKTISLEVSDLLCKTIQVSQGTPIVCIGKALFQTPWDVHSPNFTKLDSAGRILHPKLSKYIPVIEKNQLCELEPNQTIIVTGGFGGLGRGIIQQLLELGARRIIVLTRSHSLLPTSLQASIKPQFPDADIIPFQVNVGNVGMVLSLANAKFELDKYPLQGVVHIAGTIDDASIFRQTWSKFENVFATKIYGTVALNQIVQNHVGTVKFFVTFSSITSAFGTSGQANYAAGNSFMDEFCRSQVTAPYLSINWGAWAKVGMASSARVMQMGEAGGVNGIQPDEGMRIFTHLLTSLLLNSKQVPGAVIAANINWAAFLLKRNMLQNNYFSDFNSSSKNVVDVSQHKEWRLEPDMDKRMTLVLDEIKLHIANELQFSNVNELDTSLSLASLGVDSISGIAIRNRLVAALQIKLPMMLVFEFPSVDAVIQHVAHVVSTQHTHKSAQTASRDRRDNTNSTTQYQPSKVQAKYFAQWVSNKAQWHHNLVSMQMLKVAIHAQKVEAGVKLLCSQFSVLRTHFTYRASNDNTLLVNVSTLPKVKLETYVAKDSMEIMETLQKQVVARINLLDSCARILSFVSSQGSSDVIAVSIIIHHAVADFTTCRSLLEYLIAVCAEGSTEAKLPNDFDYSKFVALLNDIDNSSKLQAINYWKATIGRSKYRILPQLTSTSEYTATGFGGTIFLNMGEQLKLAIEFASKRYAIRQFSLMFAAIQILINIYTDRTQFVCGTFLNERSLSTEFQHALGCFVDELPLVSTIDLCSTINELLHDVELASLDALSQDVPLSLLQDQIQFYPQVTLNVLDIQRSELAANLEATADFSFNPIYYVRQRETTYPLCFEYYKGTSWLMAKFCANYVPEKLVRLMVTHLASIMSVICNPDSASLRISELKQSFSFLPTDDAKFLRNQPLCTKQAISDEHAWITMNQLASAKHWKNSTTNNTERKLVLSCHNLDWSCKKLRISPTENEKIAILFPGQGAQYVGMAVYSCILSQKAYNLFSLASSIIGYNILNICANGPENLLIQTDKAQMAMFLSNLAYLELVKLYNPRLQQKENAVACCAGLSLGQFSCLVFSKVLSLRDAICLVDLRGRLMKENCQSTPSCLLAVSLPTATLLPILSAITSSKKDSIKQVYLANHIAGTVNCIACRKDDVPKVKKLIKLHCKLLHSSELATRLKITQLSVDGGFHSPFMKSSAAKFAEAIKGVTFSEPMVPIVDNVTGKLLTDANDIKQSLLQHIASPLLWHQSVDFMLKMNITSFWEVGPGNVLSAQLQKTTQQQNIVRQIINIDQLLQIDSA